MFTYSRKFTEIKGTLNINKIRRILTASTFFIFYECLLVWFPEINCKYFSIKLTKFTTLSNYQPRL